MEATNIMAAFKSNLKQIMLRKSVELGYPLTQKEVSEKAGLSLPTVARWYKGSIDKIEIETVSKLIDYLGCEFDELVEFVSETVS
jgi:DNA-binding Xre family transcriptional regulator